MVILHHIMGSSRVFTAIHSKLQLQDITNFAYATIETLGIYLKLPCSDHQPTLKALPVDNGEPLRYSINISILDHSAFKLLNNVFSKITLGDQDDICRTYVASQNSLKMPVPS